MMTPTIHLNGTAAQSLLDGYCDAANATLAALEAVARTAPNARDYPQGPEVYCVARAEHDSRLARLRAVLAELNELAEAVCE